MDIKHNLHMQAQLMLLMLMLHAEEHTDVWPCLIICEAGDSRGWQGKWHGNMLNKNSQCCYE